MVKSLPKDCNNYTEELDKILEQVPSPYVICSDINGHYPNWGSSNPNYRGEMINQWLQNTDLMLLNSGAPTYETSSGNFTHIDLTLVSTSLISQFDWEVYHENLSSDHFPIIIQSTNHCINTSYYIPKYKLKDANWEGFKDNLILPEAPFSSPDDLCDKLETAIIKAANLSIPLTKPLINTKYNKFWCSSLFYLNISKYIVPKKIVPL